MSDEEAPKRAVIYCRVSTEDQAKEGFSLAAQEARLRSYCEAKGWNVIETYVDEGHSGRTEGRPAYQKMLSSRDSWDVMVVLKMDRIHRNSKNFTQMMDHLKDWGKEFTSMQESFDTTTAMGRFVMDIIQRIAQLESEQIGERVKFGMTQKAIEGNGYLGFNTPYGYDYGDGLLKRNIEEAEIIEEIFHSYIDGDSLGDIVFKFNERDVPTKKGGKWAKPTVLSIIRNPVYCGYKQWEDILSKMEHEPIIPVDLFNEVQVIRQKRTRGNGSKKNVPSTIDEKECVLVPITPS